MASGEVSKARPGLPAAKPARPGGGPAGQAWSARRPQAEDERGLRRGKESGLCWKSWRQAFPPSAEPRRGDPRNEGSMRGHRWSAATRACSPRRGRPHAKGAPFERSEGAPRCRAESSAMPSRQARASQEERSDDRTPATRPPAFEPQTPERRQGQARPQVGRSSHARGSTMHQRCGEA